MLWLRDAGNICVGGAPSIFQCGIQLHTETMKSCKRWFMNNACSLLVLFQVNCLGKALQVLCLGLGSCRSLCVFTGYKVQVDAIMWELIVDKHAEVDKQITNLWRLFFDILFMCIGLICIFETLFCCFYFAFLIILGCHKLYQVCSS